MTDSCPHLASLWNRNREEVEAAALRIKEALSSAHSDTGPKLNADADVRVDTGSNLLFCYASVSAEQSCNARSLLELWACVACGLVSCGRSASRHAETHWTQHPEHCVAVHLSSSQFWCYRCDDEIIDSTSLGDRVDFAAESESEESQNADAQKVHVYRRQFQPSSSPRELLDITDTVRSLIFQNNAESFCSSSSDNETESGDDWAAQNGESAPGSAALDSKSLLTPSFHDDRGGASGLCGLSNLGNTCFLNAVLQALNACAPLALYLQFGYPVLVEASRAYSPRGQEPRLPVGRHSYAQQQTGSALSSLFTAMWQKNTGRVSPGRCLNALTDANAMFRGYGQHDAQEAVRCLLARLDEEMQLLQSSLPGERILSPQRAGKSIVHSVFGGMMESTVECLNCGVISKSTDPFFDISCAIPRKHDEVDSLRRTKENWSDSPTGAGEISQTDNGGMFGAVARFFGFGWHSEPSLDDCVQNFAKTEVLDKHDRYHCEKCNGLQDAKKTMKLIAASQRRSGSIQGSHGAPDLLFEDLLPQVLTIHLKRFRYDTGYWGTGKISDPVALPLVDWDVKPFCVFPKGAIPQHFQTKYRLSAVVCHHGAMYSGHYTAYVLNPVTNSWYECDDGRCRAVDGEIVQAEAATAGYILFYARQHGELDMNALFSDIELWEAQNPRRHAGDYVYMSRIHWICSIYGIAIPSNHTAAEDREPNDVQAAFDPITCAHGNVRPLRRLHADEPSSAIPSPISRTGEGMVRVPRHFLDRDYLPANARGDWAGVASRLQYLRIPIVAADTFLQGVGCSLCYETDQLAQSRRNCEKSRIADLDRKNLSDGEHWYLVPVSWLKDWNAFTQGHTDCPPGKIPTIELVEPAKQKTSEGRSRRRWIPKQNMKPVKHYRGVCRQVFEFFESSYGRDGPKIIRDTIDLYAADTAHSPVRDEVNSDSDACSLGDSSDANIESVDTDTNMTSN